MTSLTNRLEGVALGAGLTGLVAFLSPNVFNSKVESQKPQNSPLEERNVRGYVLSNGLNIQSPLEVKNELLGGKITDMILVGIGDGRQKRLKTIYDPRDGKPYTVDFDSQEGKFLKNYDVASILSNN